MLKNKIDRGLKCFNTSHVVVYQDEFIETIGELGFNTSHVVVYPSLRIHPLYILFMFQYISCCSLSWLSLITMFCWIMFQYISCCSLSMVSPTKNLFSM